MPSRPAVRWIAVYAGCLAALAAGTARGQSPDVDALQRRVAELEWRAQQSDSMAIEVERLRLQLAAVNAQLRQAQQPPIAAPAVQRVAFQPPAAAEIIPPAASAASDFQPQPEPIPAPEASSYGGGSGHSGYGYADGLQFGFWGWLSYIASPQNHYATFWAWEAQLDITKSFTDRIAASADISFIDTNGGAYVTLDQCFLSILYPDCNDSIFTAGKFYAPFGIERHDFWYRETAETTLLFNAIPQELTGLMYTQPLIPTTLTLRPFVVNGFDNNLDINTQPSLGMAIEYRPCECLCLGWTNWWGPEFADDNDDKLFFTLAQSTWHITPTLSLASELLYGETESPQGRLDWTGYALIVSQTLAERWRLYGQWSDLDDPDGHFAGVAAHGRQIGCGFSFYLDRHVECRCGWAHNMTRFTTPVHSEISDAISAHLTFGY